MAVAFVTACALQHGIGGNHDFVVWKYGLLQLRPAHLQIKDSM